MTTVTMSAAALEAEEVMTRDVATIASTASVTEAWQALFSSGDTHLLVLSDGRCVGVVDDRTIALEWPSGAFESRRRQVAALCHGGPATVSPRATIHEVARAMQAAGRSAVAVTNEDGRPLGLITAAHFVALAAHPAHDVADGERAVDHGSA